MDQPEPHSLSQGEAAPASAAAGSCSGLPASSRLPAEGTGTSLGLQQRKCREGIFRQPGITPSSSFCLWKLILPPTPVTPLSSSAHTGSCMWRSCRTAGVTSAVTAPGLLLAHRKPPELRVKGSRGTRSCSPGRGNCTKSPSTSASLLSLPIRSSSSSSLMDAGRRMVSLLIPG